MKKLLIILSVLGAFILGVYVRGAIQPAPLAQAADTFEPSIEMVALAQKLGLTAEDMRMTHAQFGADSVCGDPELFNACFIPATDTIRINLRTFTSPYEDPASTLAYEYAHFAWKITPEDERAQIKPFIDSWYLAHKIQVDHMNPNIIRTEGGFGSAMFEDELHSITCTEVPDSELAPELLAHCSGFLPNRVPLKRYY